MKEVKEYLETLEPKSIVYPHEVPEVRENSGKSVERYYCNFSKGR